MCKNPQKIEYQYISMIENYSFLCDIFQNMQCEFYTEAVEVMNSDKNKYKTAYVNQVFRYHLQNFYKYWSELQEKAKIMEPKQMLQLYGNYKQKKFDKILLKAFKNFNQSL